MPSNTPETQAILPVTKAARDAACEYLSDIAGLRGKDAVTEIHDDHPTLIAFARFERDILARQSSSNAGDRGGVGELHRLLDNVGGFLDGFAQADLDEGAADAVTVGMVYQQQAQTVVLPRIRAALASLSTPTAEPPPTPHEFVKNPLIPFPSCQVCMGPENAEAHSPPTPDRIGKDAVREALRPVFVRLLLQWERRREVLNVQPGVRETWIDDATNEIASALSATPAQPVDETERLEDALRKIADDPYQHGQRIQKMKAIARAALQHKGEVSRG